MGRNKRPSGTVTFHWGESKDLTLLQKNDFNSIIEFIRDNTGFELEEFKQILIDRRFQIIKKKDSKAPCAITNKQIQQALLLARVGLKLPTIAKELGVKYETLRYHFKKDELLEQQLKDARKNRFTWLLAKCFDSANSGWFPAQKFLLERLYGDLLDENNKEDIYSEVRELKKTIFRLMKRSTTEEIEELHMEIQKMEDGDEPEVKHTSASALGEKVEEIETAEFEETEDPEEWQDEDDGEEPEE